MIRRLCSLCLSVRGKGKIGVPSRLHLSDYTKYAKSGNAESHGIGSGVSLQSVVDEMGETYLAELDEEKLKEKAELELLLDIWRAEERTFIPDTLTPNDWKILLTSMSTLEEKTLYLRKVYVRQEQRREKAEADEDYFNSIRQPYDDEDLNVLQKGLLMRKYLNQWNGIRSLLFGRPLIIDMDYGARDDYESFQTAQQIELLYKFNCEHIQPCHLHFTSAHRNKFMVDMLNMNRNILADIHTEDFLQIFPQDRLFYLVPEGPMILEEKLDEDLIFILGGIGGTTERRRSFAKAQSIGLQFGSLPIDKFVSRKVRSTVDIYLHTVMQIMLDKFIGVSWKKALDTHLPDQKFEKYPGLIGPIQSKSARKSYRQFRKLDEILKLSKRR